MSGNIPNASIKDGFKDCDHNHSLGASKEYSFGQNEVLYERMLDMLGTGKKQGIPSRYFFTQKKLKIKKYSNKEQNGRGLT